MPKFEFQVPKLSGNTNKDIKGLFNAYIDMSQQFQWLLTNLNETNVKRAKTVVADWVYAGNVTTDQLIAGEAKIDTALIDDLIVGSNVTMGEDAYISWGNVTDQPTIPPEYTDSDAVAAIDATYIDEHGVWTPNVYATNISTLNGKIGTAQIENLIVGDNVTMGEDAYISWGNVTDQPTIPDEYTDSDAIDAIDATYIDEYGVWTPNVYATNISTLNGKIGTAQIEDLVVGENVTMGESATISWGQVTDDKSYNDLTDTKPLTYINSTGLYTGQIYAQHVTINKADGTGSLNMLIDTDEYVTFRGVCTTSGNTLIVGRNTTPGDVPSTMERIDVMAGWLYVYNNLYVNSSLSIGGETAATEDWVNSQLSDYAEESWVTSNFVSGDEDDFVGSGGGTHGYLDYINNTSTGIVCRFSGGTNKSIYYADYNTTIFLKKSDGWDGTFANGDGDTVTVVDGQITSVS